MTRLELAAATALFGWQCPVLCQRFSRQLNVVVSDPFFDLFAMSCIVANTVLLALDHPHIDRQMALALLIGNHVRIYTLLKNIKIL